MKKWFVIVLVSFSVVSNSFGKDEKQFFFKIDGTINADTGTIQLEFFTEYIPNKEKVLKARIKNKTFSISGYIPEPQSVVLFLDDRYMSSNFIIEKGIQTISINTDLTRKVPLVKNNIMMNEYPMYLASFSQQKILGSLYYQKYDSLLKVYNNDLPKEIKINLSNENDDLYESGNRVLLRYSEVNPTSVFAFWALIDRMNWGYEPIFDSIFNAFSSKLKDGFAGRVLYKKLEIGKQLSIGNIFPTLQCINRNNEKLTSTIIQNNKLTLVDFWYTRCGPCRAQFPILKDLYNNFGDKGFDIVGISVDKEIDKVNWENAIIKEKLIWKQYWDMNGKDAKMLSIYAYPSNFLLDSTGKIIAKNISMDALDEQLKISLK